LKNPKNQNLPPPPLKTTANKNTDLHLLSRGESKTTGGYLGHPIGGDPAPGADPPIDSSVITAAHVITEETRVLEQSPKENSPRHHNGETMIGETRIVGQGVETTIINRK
jgi:hypothetical protein